MSDVVAASAIAVGDVAALSAREEALAPLFAVRGARLAADPAAERALADAVDAPALGAVAAVEMAREAAGWSPKMGERNGLARYEGFAAALLSGGWFHAANAPAQAAAYDDADPAGSLSAIVASLHPDLTPADARRVAAAMARSLTQALGPDGARPEAAEPGLLTAKKREVLEKRVATVATNRLDVGERPRFRMHWRSETFLRTKEGKDEPKTSTTRGPVRAHDLAFDLDRWRSGDRAALLGYYRRVEDWLDDFDAAGGKPRRMACFDKLTG